MDKLIELLDSQGPFTGKELLAKTGMDEFTAWRKCFSNEHVVMKTIGTRYLRLDRQVEGYARLSPSIIREFYGYTVIGTENMMPQILKRAELLREEIIQISRNKFALAREVISKIVESKEAADIIKAGACFIIAGDVTYEMAHLEPRPESSTGKLVKGSDLDIVVVTHDLPANIINMLDESIYAKKHYLLKHPGYNEEIDYVIKDLSKVEGQLKFSDFESMVASKVLHEGKYLYGNIEIFEKIQKMLVDEGIPEKISILEEEALINRNNAAIQLSKLEGRFPDEEDMKLFYTKEEREEFF